MTVDKCDSIDWQLLLDAYQPTNNYKPTLSRVVELQSMDSRSDDENNEMKMAFNYLITFEELLLQALEYAHNRTLEYKSTVEYYSRNEFFQFQSGAKRLIKLVEYLIQNELMLLNAANATKLNDLKQAHNLS